MSIHVENYKGYKIELHPDSDVDCPIDCQSDSSELIIAIWQRNSTIAGLNPFRTPDDALRHAKANGYDVFKIRGYIHSGVAYSCDPLAAFQYPFTCPWDSGFAGFALVKRAEFPERKKADKGLRNRSAESTLKVLTQWANGECYGFNIVSDTGVEVDSCWGYIGDEFAIESAKESIDYITREGVAA